MNTEVLKEEMEARKHWWEFEKGRHRLCDFASSLETSKVQSYMVEHNEIEIRNILNNCSSDLNREDIFQFKDVSPGKNLYIDFRYPLSTTGFLKKAYFTFVEVFHSNDDSILVSKGLKRFNLATLFLPKYAYKKDEFGFLLRDKVNDTRSIGSVIDLVNQCKSFKMAMINISNKLIKINDVWLTDVKSKYLDYEEEKLSTVVSYKLDFL